MSSKHAPKGKGFFIPALIAMFSISSPLLAAGPTPLPQTAPGLKNAVTATRLQGGQEQVKGPEDESYTYQSSGRRDPFLSLIYSAQEAEKRKRVLGRPPLEQYGVSEFKLEAIVTGNGVSSYALVRLPNGKDYILKKGKTVGINAGTVTEIAPDHIVVRETTTDYRGNRTSHNIILKLRKQEG